MTWNRSVRTLCLFLGGLVVAAGVGTVYRAFISRWEGDVRANLVAATMSGIAFFVVSNLTLHWLERREHPAPGRPRD